MKKFSKTTQKLFANNKMDTLANTRHVVEEIKNLTKMLNFTRNISNENVCTSTWANINWGDNAPFWNQYYTVVREFKYPFEVSCTVGRLSMQAKGEARYYITKSSENMALKKKHLAPCLFVHAIYFLYSSTIMYSNRVQFPSPVTVFVTRPRRKVTFSIVHTYWMYEF